MTDFAVHTARMINRIGRPVTLTPSGQPERVVNAVFATAPGIALGMIDGFRPTLRLSQADATGLSDGDSVSIAGSQYTVSRIDPDIDAGDVLATLESA